jgi:hypothetical protein
VNSTESSGSGADERRRQVLALVTNASADGDLRGLTAALQRVCRAATAALGLRGAAVHVMTENEVAGVAACTDAEARAVAELQFTANEGPAWVAFRSRRPVLVPLLDAAHDRWPGFASLALGRGVRAVFSFPLQQGAVSLGVIDLYADRAGPLGADGLALGAGFARAATELLLDGDTVGPAGELDAGLSASLVERARIHQAQGMVMVDLRVTLAEALSRMRARAFASDASLLDVADQVIAGILTADTWTSGDTPEGMRP